MALQGTFPDVRQTTRSRKTLVAATADRARSFAQARRHTLLVRALRLMLPIGALLAVASYGAGFNLSLRFKGGKLEVPSVALSTENLTMSNPRYEGFNKDGSKFVVTAKTAVQDIRQQQGPIQLNVIDGRMMQPNNTVFTVTAPRGLFDNAANKLELFDDIKVRSSDGMRADLTQATVYTKDNRIVSTQPVAIDMAAGQIRANEMDLKQGAKQVTFSNGVMTRLKSEPKPASQPVAQPKGTVGPRMIGTTDGPVDVASHSLHVDDGKKTAVFKGEVVAKQGEATLRAPELQAFYEGAPLPVPGAAPSAADAAPSGKLKRLVVPTDVTLTQGADRVTSDAADFDAIKQTAILLGRVVMTSGADRRATSDRADLDSASDSALLSGNVVVTQEKNILRGARLSVDRKAGVTRLWTPVAAGQPAGRIAAHFVQAASTAPRVAPKATPPTTNDASGFVFRTDPNAPIDIDADTLDVLDKAKTATFRGTVHAVQGGFVIRTPELVATYSGEAGLSSAAADGKQTSAQLTRVRANQKVDVTSADGQSASGDWADFDVKANTVTIGGNVVLKKGASLAYAPKAIIDMATGMTYLEKESQPAGARVTNSPTEQRAPYTLPDLPAKKEVGPSTPPAFDGNPAACPPGRMCIKIDPKDGASSQAGTKPGGKKGQNVPWQTDVAAPPKQKVPAAAASGWSSSQ
jgi:LPS export ABC transporter protein LptC/lipopolysaccharide transport protein LptA